MASLYCMPLLIVNLGGEMLYILDQRLQAQNISIDKSKKVLQDVIGTMFNPKFVEELFKPQEMYSNASTRQIFDRLAHSSIMRLNESSMDKLYDLMTMGFKYQLLGSVQPSDLLQVTFNHFDFLIDVCRDSEVQPLVEKARALVVECYGSLRLGAWLRIQQTLARFLQDRRVKVSLFLQENIQNADGSFALSCVGPVPANGQVPGKIRYYSNNAVKEEKSIELPQTRGTFKAPQEFSIYSEYRSTHLGTNMYSKNRKKPSEYPLLPTVAAMVSNGSSPMPPVSPNHASGGSSSSFSSASSSTSFASPVARAPSPNSAAAESAKKREQEISKAARVEMNLLATLVNVQKAPAENFTLQLFQDSSTADARNEIIMFDAAPSHTTRAKEIEKRLGGLNFDDVPSASSSAASAGDDLLDLLDSAQ